VVHAAANSAPLHGSIPNDADTAINIIGHPRDVFWLAALIA